jgi:hypothetical protein
MSNTVALTQNTLSVAGTGTGGVILFRNVFLRCSADNTPTENRRPRIIIYNPGKTDVNIGNWTIADNNSTFITLPAGTILHKNKQYVITPFLFGGPRQGLEYTGDHLLLSDNHSAPVDGLSWGTDLTQLNPSLTAPTVGDRYKRVPPKKDTNTFNDWQLLTKQCKTPGEDDSQQDVQVPGQFHLQETDLTPDD